MYLRSLKLLNFRNYQSETFHFSPRLNLIYGSNAQGKTSLLEALYFLVMGRSFRTVHTRDLIYHGSSYFGLEAHFVKHGVDNVIRITCDGKTRKIICNQSAYQISDLIGLLKGVLMTPDDIELVKGSPQCRRSFLDLHIAQYSPLYIHHLTRYNRALKQRNQMLKSRTVHSIESWEQELAKGAAYITLQRQKAIQELMARSSPLHSSFSSLMESLALHYKPQSGNAAEEEAVRRYYLEQFAKNRRREMELGMTLSGPHKDEMLISVNQRDIRAFASEGQQRSSIAALKLAEWDCLKEITEETPMLMLDDIGISLDDQRRAHLFSRLHNMGQVFLTTTQDDRALACGPDDRLFHIDGGQRVNNI